MIWTLLKTGNLGTLIALAVDTGGRPTGSLLVQSRAESYIVEGRQGPILVPVATQGLTPSTLPAGIHTDGRHRSATRVKGTTSEVTAL